MKALKIILIIIAALAVLIIGVMWWLGFFTKVEVMEKEVGGYILAGKDFTGSYSLVAPTMMKVDKDLRKMGIECTKGFGVYYDNPQVTPQEKCRSFVGNVLEAKDTLKIEEIVSKGFKVDTIDIKPSLVVEFPSPNKISYMIGPMIAYPALNKYMKEKGLKTSLSLEVYDVPAKKTLYIMQLE